MMPMKEVAEAIGCPLFTAYSRLRLAREHVTRAWEGDSLIDLVRKERPSAAKDRRMAVAVMARLATGSGGGALPPALSVPVGHGVGILAKATMAITLAGAVTGGVVLSRGTRHAAPTGVPRRRCGIRARSSRRSMRIG